MRESLYESEMDMENESFEEDTSDEDEKFAEGLANRTIKPGLYVDGSQLKRKIVNNTIRLRSKLDEVLLKTDWIERLDLICDLAPAAPELQIQIEKHEQKRENMFKGNLKLPRIPADSDPVLNDFKREILFHRQAQGAVVEGMKILHELGVATKRPDDYFAEMAKTDEHMQKIRANLIAKQEGHAKSERIKLLRKQRKFGKVIEKQIKVKRQEDKNKLSDQLKKFRKGKLKNLDFLEESKSKNVPNKRGAISRNTRDKKFGFGGKKRGLKKNTKQSSGEYDRPTKNKRPAKSQRAQARGTKGFKVGAKGKRK